MVLPVPQQKHGPLRLAEIPSKILRAPHGLGHLYHRQTQGLGGLFHPFHPGGVIGSLRKHVLLLYGQSQAVLRRRLAGQIGHLLGQGVQLLLVLGPQGEQQCPPVS